MAGDRDPWELVAAAQAGDRAAFATLWSNYRDMVQRYVSFRLKDSTLAEDLTSDTFERALRRIGSVSYQGRDVGAWFITIARNLILDHLKRSDTRLRSSVDAAEVADTYTRAPGPDANIPEQMIRTDAAARLRLYMAQLAPAQRTVLTMRYEQELPHGAIGRQLGGTEGGSKATLNRGLDALRAMLTEDGYLDYEDFLAGSQRRVGCRWSP